MSFKRRHRPSPSLLSGPARLLSALTGPSRTPPQRPASPSGSDYDHIPDTDPLNHSSKNGTPLDWYIEGPGRRVGYEDLTAIDWIFEYNKERQRLRSLASSPGIISRLRHLVDSSQVWIILLFTGVSVGAIAAAINIAADWLADLKLGYCSSGPEGGHFYLSKTFCCYGYDQGSKCLGWRSWSEALGATTSAGEWTVGYIFYFVFSVCRRGRSFCDPASLSC
jgi:chloride channel 3/4/5